MLFQHATEFIRVHYLLLCCLLSALFQRFLLHRSAYAGHSPGLAVLDTQTQVLDLREVVLTQSLILLTCGAAFTLV